jgi:hypothetical protein
MKRYSIVFLLMFLTGCCSFGMNKLISSRFDRLIVSQKRLIVFLKAKNPQKVKINEISSELKIFQKSLETFVSGNKKILLQPKEASSMPFCLKVRLKEIQNNFYAIGNHFKRHRHSLNKTPVLRHLVFIARDVRRLKKQMKHFFIVPRGMEQ